MGLRRPTQTFTWGDKLWTGCVWWNPWRKHYTLRWQSHVVFKERWCRFFEWEHITNFTRSPTSVSECRCCGDWRRSGFMCDHRIPQQDLSFRTTTPSTDGENRMCHDVVEKPQSETWSLCSFAFVFALDFSPFAKTLIQGFFSVYVFPLLFLFFLFFFFCFSLFFLFAFTFVVVVLLLLFLL